MRPTYPRRRSFHVLDLGQAAVMSEPREIASAVEPVVDGIWHWRIHNAAIGGGISSSHAVRVTLDDGRVGCVLLDPVRLDPHAMQQLPHLVVAVVLTSRGHQRAAWRIRRDHGAEVWAPQGATGFDEEPDRRYGAGDELPGGLVALHTPGPEAAHYSLHLPDAGALVVSDLVRRDEAGRLSIIPAHLHEQPERTRQSIDELAGLGCEIVLLDHGPPITRDGASALRQVLAEA